MKMEKSCGALVYRFNNGVTELLLIKNRNGGHWAFPKGHIELNETEQETALREVKEETGYDIKILEKFRTSVSYKPKPDTSKEVVYFLATVSGGTMCRQEAEISRLEWIDIDKAQKIVTFENDRKLIIKAKSYIAELKGEAL